MAADGMPDGARRVTRVYLTLTLLSTLASSFIWGVNTLFLLDAGLSATGAFVANAFFTAGQVLFELPTGVVADTRGRRTSYLLGSATLLLTTLLYVLLWWLQAPLWAWAGASVLIGLGFTFFSGAVEAWLVDALDAAGYDGDLESIFARGQVITGVAMLVGSVTGGVVAQATNLGMPYMLRAVLLLAVLVVAAIAMHDEGFTPHREGTAGDRVRALLTASLNLGWRDPPLRWLMLAAACTSGAGIFAFYGMQPYLLELYGDPSEFAIAGLAAALVAGAQIVGGLVVPLVRRLFRRRTSALLAGAALNTVVLVGIGLAPNFPVALVLIMVWALAFAATGPVRQAFVNGLIPSEQRATVLSFDALVASSGGVVAQPALGRAADAFGFGPAYLITGAVTAGAVPFIALARREQAPSDPIVGSQGPAIGGEDQSSTGSV